jgi:membrane peptidoglycan carboxypeptidase
VRPLTWLARLGLVVFAGALLVSAVVVAVAPRIWTVATAHDELPVDLPSFQPLAQRSYVYDALGNEIAVFELENSQPIALAQVPQHVIDAFLAVEDKEFYHHDGVNVRSLVRATLSNFASDSPQQGASTITMQVVKNDFLAGLERDGRYKLLQVHYALMLDREYTKDEILERYLNTVFFGNNSYGIQAAAETYFGKTADQLTFIEAAFLAGLVRSPSGYDPINNPERSRARFVQILDRLVDDGLVTADEAATLATDFVLPERARTLPERQYVRTYFTEALRDFLLHKSTMLGSSYDERYRTLFRGGLRIHTTFDPNLQVLAEQARNILPDTPQRFDASIVSLDTKTGAVRAMVGGKEFIPGEREVNMALRPRQTGSSIKLFVLAAALQAGAQPSDLIDGSNVCTFAVPDQPPFVIRDAVMASGPLNEMTWRSINCAYVRLAQIVGLNRVVDTTYRMAQSVYLYPGQPAEERRPIEPFVSYSTGANEMSPMDMAAGAQTIANGGLHHEPYYVEYIDAADGRRLYTHTSTGTQVFDKNVALTAVDVLKGVLISGTGRRYPLNRPAAGKTGTQADNTNAWFVGFTPELTTSVWVGDPDGYTPMNNIPEFAGANQDAVQGGRYPTQIWQAYMNPALASAPLSDWEPPPPDARPPARLYLPGNECLARAVVSGGEVVGTVPPAAPLPPAGPAGFAPTQTPQTPPAPPAPPAAPPPETTPSATTVPGPAPGTPITAPRVTRMVPVEGGTTVPPNVLDPRAPLPSTPMSSTVIRC